MEEKNFESYYKNITLQISEEKLFSFSRTIFKEHSYKNINNLKIIDFPTVESFLNLPLPLSERLFEIIKNKKNTDFFEEKEFLRMIHILYLSDISVKIDFFFKFMDLDCSNTLYKSNVKFMLSHMTLLSYNLIEQFFGRHTSFKYDEYIERITVQNCDLILFFYFYIAEKRPFNENIINYYMKSVKENESHVNDAECKSNEIYPLRSILRNKKEKKVNNTFSDLYNDNSFDDTDSGIKKNVPQKARSSIFNSMHNINKCDSYIQKNKISLTDFHWKASHNLNFFTNEYLNMDKESEFIDDEMLINTENENKESNQYLNKINNNNNYNAYNFGTNNLEVDMNILNLNNPTKLDGNCTVTSTCLKKQNKKVEIVKNSFLNANNVPIIEKSNNSKIIFLDDDIPVIQKNIRIDNEEDDDEELLELEEFENEVQKSISKNFKYSLAIRSINVNEMPLKSRTFAKKEEFKNENLFLITPLTLANKNNIEEFHVLNKKYISTKLILYNNSFLFVFSQEIEGKSMFKHILYLKSCFIKNKEKDEIEICVSNYKYNQFHFTQNNKDYFLYCINHREILQEYQVIEELKKSNMFVEFKASKKDETYIIKVYIKNEINSPVIRNIQYISKFLMNHKHKNIVNIIDMHETMNNLFIIMEYYPSESIGNKDTINIKNKKYNDYIIYQLLDAVNFLHSFGIIHRNIKMENVIINNPNDYSIKLIDFSCSIISSKSENDGGIIGNSIYTAPEIILKQPYGSKSDLWSIGIISYVLFFGKLPVNQIYYDKKNINDIKIKYEQINQKISQLNYDSINNESKTIQVAKMTVVKSAIQRHSAKSVLEKVYCK